MTRKFTFLLMALLALTGFKSWGQETLTVCDGTSTEQIVPVFINYFDTQGTISQYVIPSSDIAAMTGKEISAMKFYISYTNSDDLGSVLSSAKVTCKLQEVSSPVVSSIQSGGTTVFSGNLTTSNNELDCLFDTPYTYQGGNLLISFEVSDDGSFAWTIFYGINPEYNSAITNKGSDPDVPQAFIPKTTFTYASTNKKTLTVNEGSTYNEYVPFYGYYADNLTKSQFIIPATTLSAMEGADITAMEFYTTTSGYNVGPADYTFGGSWDVYFKIVDYVEMPYSYEPLDGMDKKVYTGNMVISGSKMVLTFSEPYTYEGGNLMICFNQTASTGYRHTYWRGTTTQKYAARGGYTTSNGNYYFLPTTTFTYIPGATYTVNLTQPGAGGTIDANPKADVAAGTTVTLSATPATGYEFGEWTVTNTTTSEAITVTDNQFTMPDSDVTVTATFEALVPHTVTIADGIQNGTVRLFDGDPTQYIAGETVRLEVTADEGYFYPNEDEITVTDAAGNNIDVIIDAPNYSFIMPNSDVTVWAVFNMYYGVQVDTEILGGHISVTSDFEHYPTLPFFTAGTYVYFIPSPDEDYEYVEQSVRVYEWDLEQHEIGDPITVDFSSGSARITMPETDIFVTATFNRTKFNVTQQIANPMGGGNFNIENAEHILVGTSVVISDIAPSWDYQFVSVTVTRNDNQATVETYKYNDDYVFTMPNSDVTVTVNFEAIPYYDVTINEPENGSAYINGAQSYHAGDEVVLTANPYEGYIISATDITITPAEGEPFHPTYVEYMGYVFNMPASDVTITAAFREIQTYTINYYVNGELEDTAPCKENEAIDIYTYTPYVSGVNFEGWGVAPIGTYVTEKPAIIGDDEYPTQNYDLHAVFSYSEQIPATSKDGETWKKVTSTSDLKANDKIVLVYNGYIMSQRWNESFPNYEIGYVTVSNNEITTSLPENAIEFTWVNESGNWKLKYQDFGNEATLSYDRINECLIPQGLWGASCNNWTAVQKGSAVIMKNADEDIYIAYYNGNYMIYPLPTDGTACEVFKLDIPFITNTYYMTSVLTNGEVTENTTAKNIIISSITSINVKDGATLTMDANGLFRNKNEIMGFVFEDGTQFYYTGTENVKATFEKVINGYSGTNDNYYLIANPTATEEVANLVNEDGYDLYTFNPAQALEWNNEKASNALTSGIGYLYANSETVTLEFYGELTPAGSINKSLTYAAAGEGIDFPGFNLLGNPYACNVYLDKPAYLLDGGEYQSIAANTAIAPCKGFFVEATAANQSVTISTTAPEAPTSALSLTVSQNRGNVIDRAIVSFDGSSNLHKFMMNPAHTNIRLAKQGEEFAALSSDAEGEIPVSFKAEKNGTYTISVNTENVEANYLHLIDNMTGADVDLLSTPSYTFNASTSDYAYRFKLVFDVTMDDANNGNDGMGSSFAYISNGELIISNEGRATLQVIDVMGRIVRNQQIEGDARISTEGMVAGVYVLNLNGNVQKIVVR